MCTSYGLQILNYGTSCAQKVEGHYQDAYRHIGYKILFVFTVCVVIPTIFIAEQFRMSSHLPVSFLAVISAFALTC